MYTCDQAVRMYIHLYVQCMYVCDQAVCTYVHMYSCVFNVRKMCRLCAYTMYTHVQSSCGSLPVSVCIVFVTRFVLVAHETCACSS